MKRNCMTCGKEFTYYGRGRGKYCSRACYFANRWGKGHQEFIKCLFCHTEFIAFVSDKRKFCSVQCAGLWRSENYIGPQSPHYIGRIKYGTRGQYYAIKTPYHPYCDSKGYVMEHRLIMERKLGRFLKPTEIVHHIDGNGHNNNLPNLRLMSKRQHDRLSAQERWGDPDVPFRSCNRNGRN